MKKTTYTAHCSTLSYPRHASFEFESAAKTRNGILRAAGRAIARNLRDDAIGLDCLSYHVDDGELPRHIATIKPTMWEDMHIVFKAAKDELFNIMYAA